ncbi:MAG: sulfatase-like hydrolase/transferase [Asticcacaulis sp.]
MLVQPLPRKRATRPGTGRSLLAALTALTVGPLATFAGAADAAPRRPNVLVIVADDLGYGELGVQGYTKDIPTPNIDALASSGVRFTSGYVSGPYCSPTRAGLLTGRYQQRSGHEFNPSPVSEINPALSGHQDAPGLALSETTIGDRFHAAGYKTAWIGKSHQGLTPEQHPLSRGFDEFYGFLSGARNYSQVDSGAVTANTLLRGREPVPASEFAGKTYYTTDLFTEEAVNFIGRNKDQPWLLYLAYNAVHGPLDTIPKYEDRFKNIKDDKRRKFAALLSALDDGVGAIRGKLKELGLDENTLIVFISDNGGPTPSITSGNGPLRGYKAQTWEGGVRVPFFVSWKGHVPAGKVETKPVIQLDILPTALAAAGVEPKAEWKLDGVNLLPYLSGKTQSPPERPLFWRFGQQLAVRQGDWKLVKAVDGGGANAGGAESRAGASLDGAQLYNLATDIGEKNDVAAQNPDKVRELSALWAAWNKDLPQPRWYPVRGKQGAAAEATSNAPASNANTKGPWKSGDELSGEDAPQIANKAFRLDAEIDPKSPDGVIVAQGAQSRGFAFFLKNGHLAFAVRRDGELSTVVAAQPLPAGRQAVAVSLAEDGKVTFFVNGKVAGEGKVAGLIPQQPGQGLSVGSDGEGAVGEYEAPHALQGHVGNVRINLK